ncbi:hypothetical protein ACFQLX_16850 [Streptomyces polyrhachis]|uniref:Lipoprotein n=1 Tax=Streptomyces polyrhachis TaxID=1282885 RepID=A0ABW2GGP3_9ACTN
MRPAVNKERPVVFRIPFGPPGRSPAARTHAAARFRTAAAPLLLLTAALTGCSDGGVPLAERSAEEIGRSALAAMREADSLTVEGYLAPVAGPRSQLRLSLGREGGCVGTIDSAAPPSRVRVLVAGGSSYMKPDRRYLVANAGGREQAQLTEGRIAGRWLRLDGRSGAGEFRDLCDLDRLLAGLLPARAGARTRKGAQGTLGGRPVIAVTGVDGRRSTTAWVATEGTPYILRLDSRGGEAAGSGSSSLAFSDFDAARRVRAPGTGEFVDMARLNS